MIKTTIGDMISSEVKISLYNSVNYNNELIECKKQVKELEEYVIEMNSFEL